MKDREFGGCTKCLATTIASSHIGLYKPIYSLNIHEKIIKGINQYKILSYEKPI